MSTAYNGRKIRKSDSEWQKLLDAEQYYVLRDKGTECVFSSPLNEEKRQGIYCLNYKLD